MTPRSFFIIVIKIVGICVLLSLLTVVYRLTLSPFVYGLETNNLLTTVSILVALLLIISGIFYLVIHFLILKPEKIVNLLRLDKDFSEEKFEINIHPSAILRIAIIVIGIIMLVNALPGLFQNTASYFINKKDFPQVKGLNLGGIIFDFLQLLLSIAFILKNRTIVNFIERQKKK